MGHRSLSTSTTSQILNLKQQGKTKYDVAKCLNISYSAVSLRWNNDALVSQLAEEVDSKSIQCRFESDRGYQEAYSFLLGCYLGDGYIKKMKYGYRFEIYQDKRYPKTIKEYKKAMSVLLPNNKPGSFITKNMVVVNVYNKHLLKYFPQGKTPGQKWKKDISLEPWQHAIVRACPEQFLKGLMWTDGCRARCKRRYKDKTYEYVEWAFTNKSKQIFDLFREACAVLDVIPSKTVFDKNGNIYRCKISKRKYVDYLDLIIGEKH